MMKIHVMTLNDLGRVWAGGSKYFLESFLVHNLTILVVAKSYRQ